MTRDSPPAAGGPLASPEGPLRPDRAGSSWSRPQHDYDNPY